MFAVGGHDAELALALIESGISTPYELKTAAGLSPGATIPALRRLLEEGLILQGKPGPRGRTGHRITAEGRRYLNRGWKDLIEDGPSGDLDADLRVALLAIWVGGDRQLAADFLRQSAAQKLKSIGSAEEPDKPASLPPLALWYSRLRVASVEALKKGESAAALAITKSLPRGPREINTKPSSWYRLAAVPKGPRKAPYFVSDV
jgi:DNA-binding PadR family transcriptional regulator